MERDLDFGILWLEILWIQQISAAQEEERVRELRQEKDRRLRQFQDDVKQRVVHLARLKRQQQLVQSFKAVGEAWTDYAYKYLFLSSTSRNSQIIFFRESGGISACASNVI